MHENTLVKVPRARSPTRATPLGRGVTTGLGAVLNMAKVTPGSTFELIGLKDTTAQAFGKLGRGGTATAGMIIGHRIEFDGLALQFEQCIQGSIMGSKRFRIDILPYAALGRLCLDALATARVPLNGLNGMLDALGWGTERTRSSSSTERGMRGDFDYPATSRSSNCESQTGRLSSRAVLRPMA